MLELLVLVLSLYVLLSMLAELFVSMSPEMKHLLTLIDYGVCAIFLIDFFVRLYRAPSKARFMRWGWIDLVSSIPYGALQAGRIVRVVRILRILRSIRELMVFLRRRKRNTLAFLTVCAGILTLIFSTIAVLAFEDDPASNIKSPGGRDLVGLHHHDHGRLRRPVPRHHGGPGGRRGAHGCGSGHFQRFHGTAGPVLSGAGGGEGRFRHLPADGGGAPPQGVRGAPDFPGTARLRLPHACLPFPAGSRLFVLTPAAIIGRW